MCSNILFEMKQCNGQALVHQELGAMSEVKSKEVERGKNQKQTGH